MGGVWVLGPHIAVSCPALPAGLRGGCEALVQGQLWDLWGTVRSHWGGDGGTGHHDLGQTSLNVAMRSGDPEVPLSRKRSPEVARGAVG